MGSIPGPGRSPGVGNGTPLQYSCLGNPMDRQAWWSTVHGVAKELDMTEHTYTHDMGLDHQSEKTTSQKDREPSKVDRVRFLEAPAAPGINL